MSGLLIFLLLLNAYIVAVYLIGRSGRFKGTLEPAGPFLMYKTQRGKPTIDRIASASPRFWKRWGDLSIYVTWVAGLLILMLLVFQLYVVWTSPRIVADNAPPPQYLIGLPGVNPMIPVGYGIVGLIIALVIHEGSHGILARVERMKVKSLGLLFFIVPIGAFVEPDEKDMERSSSRAKNRVFAAGPMSNIALATVAGIIFSGVLMSAVGVANDGEGVGIAQVIPETPAEAADLQAGDIIVSINGHPVRDVDEFRNVMNATQADQTIAIGFIRDGESGTTSATLMDRAAFIQRENPDAEPTEEDRGAGFLGVVQMDLRFATVITGVLKNPLQDGILRSFSPAGGSFWLFVSYPFIIISQGLDFLADPYRNFLVVGGVFAGVSESGFYVTANLFYWLFWLNLMLGTFNALPAGPLDGGQMLKATLRERLFRWYKVDESKLVVDDDETLPTARVKAADPETQVKLERVHRALKTATWSVGLTILGLILIPILGPGLIRLFIG